MATTIPNVLRDLGDKNPEGFTKSELLTAFINEGYNPEKAARRYKQCIASYQIVAVPDGDKWVTLYSYAQWILHPDLLKDVKVRAVKIERDGSVTVL